MVVGVDLINDVSHKSGGGGLSKEWYVFKPFKELEINNNRFLYVRLPCKDDQGNNLWKIFFLQKS